MITAYLPDILALPLYPLLAWQGRRTRAVTPRLPEATGSSQGQAVCMTSSRVLHLLGIGESPVAGVGVQTYQQAITAQLAETLSDSLHASITWQALGQNGACLEDALSHVQAGLDGKTPPACWDIVFIAFGVNDSTSFNSPRRYRQALGKLIQVLKESQEQEMLILISGVPPMQYFPALPWPLRSVLGLKARALDQAARHLAAKTSAVFHIPMQMDFADKRLMAEDGYHPSALGNKIWAQEISKIFLENRQEK